MRKVTMRFVWMVLAMTAMTGTAAAEAPPIEARVAALETRVAALERPAAPEEPTPAESPTPPPPPAAPPTLELPGYVKRVVEAYRPRSLRLQVESLKPGEALVIPAGVWEFDNNPTLPGRGDIAIVGAGMGKTIIKGGLGARGNTMLENVLIRGITFVDAVRDPARPEWDAEKLDRGNGLSFLRPGRNLVIEDVEVSHFANGITIDPQTKNLSMRGVTLRRVYVHHNYHLKDKFKGQGLWAKADDLHIVDSRFEFNGIAPPEAEAKGYGRDKYKHNLYIPNHSNNVRIERCVIRGASAHGLQLRNGGGTLYTGDNPREDLPGGIFDCLFLDNPIAFYASKSPTLIHGNVLVGNRWNIRLGDGNSGIRLADVRGNVVAHPMTHDLRDIVSGVQGIKSEGKLIDGQKSVIRLAGNVLHAAAGGVRMTGNDAVEADDTRIVDDPPSREELIAKWHAEHGAAVPRSHTPE